ISQSTISDLDITFAVEVTAQHLAQSGLASAGGTSDGDHRAWPDRCVDSIERRSRPAGIRDAHPGERDRHMAQVGYPESRLGLRLVEHRRNVTQSSTPLGRGVELSAHA